MKGKGKEEDTAIANFEESNEFVTMEASGLNIEFRSDESSSEDEEIATQGDKNNNATTTPGKAKRKKGGNKSASKGLQPDEGELLSDEDSARINRMEEKKVSSSRKTHRGSLQKDEREDLIGEAMSRMQDLIVKTGFVETANLLQKQLVENKAINEKLMESTRIKGNENFEQILPNNATSEVTIYRNAVANEIGKRDSTSSEEDVNNISDEIDPRNSAEFSDLNSQRAYPPLNRDYYVNGEELNNIDVMISEARNNSQEHVRQGDTVREVPQR